MPDLTEEELAAMRARCAWPTEGPWRAEPNDDRDPNSFPFWIVAPDAPNREPLRGHFDFAGDAAFCAAARTDLPRALDEIDRLRGLLAEREKSLAKSEAYDGTVAAYIAVVERAEQAEQQLAEERMAADAEAEASRWQRDRLCERIKALETEGAAALSWALDLLDMYDERFAELDGRERVYSPVHVAGKAKARAALEAIRHHEPPASEDTADLDWLTREHHSLFVYWRDGAYVWQVPDWDVKDTPRAAIRAARQASAGEERELELPPRPEPVQYQATALPPQERPMLELEGAKCATCDGAGWTKVLRTTTTCVACGGTGITKGPPE